MHVIVGGCGRLGAEIATRLSGEGEDVVVIDVVGEAFDRLGSAFNGDTLVGDVTDRDSLERAGIDHADGLLAVTRYDNANLMAVEVAKVIYGVRRTVARLFNPEREISYQKLGIRYVSGTTFLAKEFLNELREGTFRHHLAFRHGDIAIVEFRLGDAAHGLTVEALELEGKLRIAAIERGDRIIIPTAQARLERDDLVVAAVRKGVHRRLTPLLQAESRRDEPAPVG